MLTPKDLWNRDLDKFTEEWDACLEADANHRSAAKNTAKGKSRAKAIKKKAAYSDESDEEVGSRYSYTSPYVDIALQEYAPTKKKASPKAKKASPKVKKEAAPKADKKPVVKAAAKATTSSKPSSKRSADSGSEDEKPLKKPAAKKAKKV